MGFSDKSLEAKYRSVGFGSDPLGMKLKIGNVRLSAAEHPWKGIVIIFTCWQERSMTQFDIAIPFACSAEQIAGMIYTNFAVALADDQIACQRHFSAMHIPLFQ